MRLYITRLILLSALFYCNDPFVFSQTSSGGRKSVSVFISGGIDNNRYKALNTFLASQQRDARLNTHAFNLAFGFVTSNRSAIGHELSTNFSSQSYEAASKAYQLEHSGVRLLLHYYLLEKPAARISVCGGLQLQLTSLGIDSIFKQGAAHFFSSSTLTTTFIQVPAGIMIRRSIHRHDPEKPDRGGPWLGIRASYVLSVYQTEWLVARNAGLRHNIGPASYYEASLLFGL